MIKFISHITLSVLLLLSATGMTINLHYCHDQLIDLALIVPAQSCCETSTRENHCHHGSIIDKPNHCDDETIGFESTSDYLISAYTLNLEDTPSFDLFYSTPLVPDGQRTRESTITTLFNFKKPPNPQEVVLSQIQSFLI